MLAMCGQCVELTNTTVGANVRGRAVRAAIEMHGAKGDGVPSASQEPEGRDETMTAVRGERRMRQSAQDRTEPVLFRDLRL